MANPLDLLRGIKALRGVSLREKGMLWTLALSGNADGTNIYPSHATIAESVELDISNVRRLLTMLIKKGVLIPDGKHGYVNQYRLNIPGVTPISPATPATDISKEEWEAMMLPPEEDDDATEMRMPVVKPPPAPPPETPAPAPAPGRSKLSPEEALEGAAKLVRLGMRDYEWYLKGGRKKGYTDEYLDWMFRGGGETGSGSQPYEPESATTNISEGTH